MRNVFLLPNQKLKAGHKTFNDRCQLLGLLGSYVLRNVISSVQLNNTAIVIGISEDI